MDDGSSTELLYHLNLIIMAKKIIEKEIVKEKLNLYVNQRDEIEALINKYIELYQKLNGAIEATEDILKEIEEEKSSTTTNSLE